MGAMGRCATRVTWARQRYSSFYRCWHSDVSTTMIYTHVLKVAAGGTASPLDGLVAPIPQPAAFDRIPG